MITLLYVEDITLLLTLLITLLLPECDFRVSAADFSFNADEFVSSMVPVEAKTAVDEVVTKS